MARAGWAHVKVNLDLDLENELTNSTAAEVVEMVMVQVYHQPDQADAKYKM